MKPQQRFRRRSGLLAATMLGGLIASVVQAAPGDPFGPPFTISSDPGGTSPASFPQVARDADGDTVVVWRSSIGILARLLDANGNPKGADFLVGDGLVPDVAMDEDGDFVVSWLYNDPVEPLIQARRFAADGTPLSDAFAVSEPLDPAFAQAEFGTSAVAMDADGDFVVAWDQGRFLHYGSEFTCSYGLGLCAEIGGYSVRARRYSDGGTLAGDIRTVDSAGELSITIAWLPAHAGSAQDHASVAMAPDGSYVVAWNRLGSGLAPLSGIYARRYAADDSPGLTRLVSLQVGDQGTPEVAVDAGGGFVVAYRRQARAPRDYSYGIYLRRYPAVGLGAPEQRVDDASATNPAKPEVAMDPAGNFVVVWHAQTAFVEDRVQAQRYAVGGGALGINFTVASSPFGLTDPSVAMDAAGNFAVTWLDYDAGVQGRLYDGP